jgi:hypothetical protein
MFRRIASCLAVALFTLLVSQTARAVVIYSDNFNSNTSSNYSVYTTAGVGPGPTGDATFAYNYGAAPASGGLSIPPAPHTTDGSTLGLRVRTGNLQNANAAAIVGATAVVTKNLTLPPVYTLNVDVWSNYIGGNSTGTGLASSGGNGSTGTAIGVGTSGTKLQYIASNDGMLVEAFGDNGGGTNGAYRVYVDNTSPRPTPTNSLYYAAGTGTNSASYTDPYYNSFGHETAPAGQVSFSATQQGTTPVGTLGFDWHTWTIDNDGTSVKWYIDNKLITTVPVASLSFGGSQISLGNDDTGTGGNAAALNQLLNAQIFDNLTITSVPEASAALFGGVAVVLSGVGAWLRRRSSC